MCLILIIGKIFNSTICYYCIANLIFLVGGGVMFKKLFGASKSKTGDVKLPTQLKEYGELGQKIEGTFTSLRKTTEELAQVLEKSNHEARLYVYHPRDTDRIYNHEFKGVTNFGEGDMGLITRGGILVIVKSDDSKLKNSLEKAGFQIHLQDWSRKGPGTPGYGEVAYLISPWSEKNAVSVSEIQKIPKQVSDELSVGVRPSMV